MYEYKILYCLKEDPYEKKAWSFDRIDMSKETFTCLHCQEQHSIKESLRMVEESKTKFTLIKG